LKPLKTKRSASLTPSTSTSSTPVQPPAQTAPNPTTPQPLAPSPLNQNSKLNTQHLTLKTPLPVRLPCSGALIPVPLTLVLRWMGPIVGWAMNRDRSSS
jgi:hypothetical protein